MVKVSEQLVRKPYLGASGSNLAPGATYESQQQQQQHFRSLEDLHQQPQLPAHQQPLQQQVVMQHSFLYSSDSNLSHRVQEQEPPPQLLDGSAKGSRILRPCDQYPSEPGVLKPRPVSSLSARSGSHETQQRLVDNQDKVGPVKLFIRLSNQG